MKLCFLFNMGPICKQRAIAVIALWLLHQYMMILWFHFLEHKVADKKMWRSERHIQAQLPHVIVILHKTLGLFLRKCSKWKFSARGLH